MAFPPEFLREVGERNRIEEIAPSYVNLRRRGKNLVGLCPFHNEKTPSFCVYPEKMCIRDRIWTRAWSTR